MCQVHFALHQTPSPRQNDEMEMRVQEVCQSVTACLLCAHCKGCCQLESELLTALEEVARLETELHTSWDEVCLQLHLSHTAACALKVLT